MHEINQNKGINESNFQDLNKERNSYDIISKTIPENFVGRLYKNAKAQAKKLEELRKIRNQIEMRECTFDPFKK